MDITIKITDKDNVVYEKIITLTEKFQSQLPELHTIEYIFSEVVRKIQSHIHAKLVEDGTYTHWTPDK